MTADNLSIWDKMFRLKPVKRQVELNRRPSSIVDENEATRTLERTLGVKDLIAFGVSSTVGSGVFVVSGIAAQYAGASLFISFIIGGISCCFSGLCYAEFATRIPVSGSAYTYAYCSLGEIVGFLIGWDLTLEYGISAATVAQGWASYLQSFLENCGVSHEYLPDLLFGRNINKYFTINIMAGAIIVICTMLLIYGIRESARFTNFITVWNILLILFFVIAGCFYVDAENWFHPCDQLQYNSSCDSDQHNTIYPRGITGIIRASGMVFFSYVGFDAVSCLAEETVNLRTNMVHGILITLLIATSLYVAVSIVLTGMVPFTALDQDSPLTDAFKSHNSNVIGTLVSFGALTTTAATTLTSLIGQPRIFYRMAKDGLFFKLFGDIHPKYRTPIWGSILSGFVATLIGTFINFDLLAEMISVGTLMAYILVSGGVVILRYQTYDNNKIPFMFKGARFALVVSAYALLCLCLGFAIDELPSFTFPWLILIIVIGILILLCFACILYVHFTVPSYLPDNVFMCPYVPVIPCLGIFINAYMIASLKWESFIRVLAWFLVGTTVYIFYGSKHSKLNNVKLLPERTHNRNHIVKLQEESGDLINQSIDEGDEN